ncbi:MAG: hypothetical protein ACUVQ0_04135 [Thermoproteota archaeon]
MEQVRRVDLLDLYFLILSTSCLPDEWAKLLIKVKKDKKVSIQLFNPSSIVGELIPLLIYNVHQAFKYGYNSLRGFEQELLVVLYGNRNFQKASSVVGVSAGKPAAILLVSQYPEDLSSAASCLKEEFLKTGSSLESFQDDVHNFVLFWKEVFLRETGIDTERLDYPLVLNILRERMATIYV